MSQPNDMQIFAQELEKNIKLYDIICRKLFPWNYVSTAIIWCLESPLTNDYIWEKFREIYSDLNKQTQWEMQHICQKIWFILT